MKTRILRSQPGLARRAVFNDGGAGAARFHDKTQPKPDQIAPYRLNTTRASDKSGLAYVAYHLPNQPSAGRIISAPQNFSHGDAIPLTIFLREIAILCISRCANCGGLLRHAQTQPPSSGIEFKTN
ncbi:MAG TPA: hypothetical protein VF472_08125 [Burkholderiaceae bacterium]